MSEKAIRAIIKAVRANCAAKDGGPGSGPKPGGGKGGKEDWQKAGAPSKEEYDDDPMAYAEYNEKDDPSAAYAKKKKNKYENMVGKGKK